MNHKMQRMLNEELYDMLEGRAPDHWIHDVVRLRFIRAFRQWKLLRAWKRKLLESKKRMDKLNEFSRRRIREDGFFPRILPPVHVSNAELDACPDPKPDAHHVEQDRANRTEE